MAKRKHKSQKNIAQRIAALRVNGTKAFQRGSYDQAITSWEKIPEEARPAAALAEAYFRRGLERLYGPHPAPAVGLEDLHRAHRYQPADGCYAHHLGLAAHRRGDLSTAVQAYSTARKAGGEFARRAAYPLTLVLLQQGQELPDNPVWTDLTSTERVMLQSAAAFRRRPYRLPIESPRLWQALVSLDAGDLSVAQTGLQESLEAAQTSVEKGMVHDYLGILALQSGDWEGARREWDAAYAVGRRTTRLQENLAELYYRMAEQLLGEGDAQTALRAAQESARHQPDDNALNQLRVQIHQQLGYQAAITNHWKEAHTHWQVAVQLDSSSFRLAYNLALAYERADDFAAAAEAWREALRRRPRRSDHPDALSDEQVSRLWQRVAESYRKAGDAAESLRVYQQSIKWSPEDVNLRLVLAEGLLMDGRLVAARNELDRILERDPQFVPALLRMGETFFANEDQRWMKDQAKIYWDKAFSLQPDNPRVRQAMADWYIDLAEIDYSWSDFSDALVNYQEALEYKPNDAQVIAQIADCYIQTNDEAGAQQYIEQALKISDDLDVYYVIIGAWITADRPEQAWETVIGAEDRGIAIPASFYVAQAVRWLARTRKDPALPWLDRAVAKAGPDEAVLVMIGEMLIQYDHVLARQYLEQAITAGQMPGQAHLLLGLLDDKQGNHRGRDKHFAEAKLIAHRTGDDGLAERVDLAQMMSGGALGFLRYLVDVEDPEAVEVLLDDLIEELEDD